MKKITPFLWFDGQAEEVAKFYTSIFRKSKILQRTYYSRSASEASGRPAGTVLTVVFELDGQRFVALNGGPAFKFNEAISFAVYCRTQAELDRFWKKLSAGGKEGQCGWLKDKFGVSWQIVPSILDDLLGGDAAQTERVLKAILGMKKLDLKALKKTYAGRN